MGVFSFLRGIRTSGPQDDAAVPPPISAPAQEHPPGGEPASPEEIGSGQAATGPAETASAIPPAGEPAADMSAAPEGPGPIIAIDFSAGGNSEEYLTHGWLRAEADATWTNGDESGIRVALPQGIAGARCAVAVERVDVERYGGPPAQLVYVLANRIFVGKAVLSGAATFAFVVPQSACGPGERLTIILLLPAASRLGGAPEADEDRRRALAVSSLEIFDHPPGASLPGQPLEGFAGILVTPRARDEADTAMPEADDSDGESASPEPLPPPDGDLTEILELSFTSEGNAEPYLGDGWSGAEDEFTWTEDDESEVYIPRPTGPGPFMLRLSYGVCVAPKVPLQRLEVYLNDSRIGTLDVGEDGPDECEFVLESSAFGTLSMATLRLHHPDALRPIEHFDIEDSRRLAFAFRSITLLNAASAAKQE